MKITSSTGASSPAHSAVTLVRVSSAVRHTPDGELIVGTRELNLEGEDMLKRTLRVVEADPDASAQTRIETLLQMGDWYQIKKSPRSLRRSDRWMHAREIGEQGSRGSRVALAQRGRHSQQWIVSRPEIRADPQHAEQRFTHLRQHPLDVGRRSNVAPDFEEAITRRPVRGQT